MSRPLRIEFNGALYHITSRGNARSDIYLKDADRHAFLNILDKVCQQYNWTIHAYCLMTNHYHLLVETPDANLSRGMRQLNGVYTQKFNHLHNRVGHIYQGRYKAIIVRREAYLLEMTQFVLRIKALAIV
ncbi:MAG: transposase [Oceanospirillaceae bacterium]|nr:transposase [Oceanospirillaceae bacterium]